ncbi:MAG: hypothetical protein KAH17_09090 [Bacteroidales bacterium]|nr:hypothetical protein [Bacteroidales bacterium]
MLILKVNDESLDLLPDAVISIDEQSSVFGSNSIPGGFSFPFSLPNTPKNSRILNFPDRPTIVNNSNRDFDFQLYHSGKLQATGILTVKESGLNFECYLLVGSGAFADKIKNKKLADLNLGGERTWSWKAEYSAPDDDFTIFPIHNPDMFLETLYEDSFANNDFRINAFEDDQFYQGPNFFAVCPFTFLTYIIHRIMADHGFEITENILKTNKDFRDLVLYSNFDIHTLIQTTELREGQIVIDDFGRETWEWEEVTITERALDKFDLANSMPDIKITDFIISLQNRLDIAFVFDQDKVKIIDRQALILSESTEDITHLATANPYVLLPEVPDGFVISWEHDPSDDLFSDENFKKIDEYLEYLKDPVANTSEMYALTPEVNEIRFIESIGAYYRFARFDFEFGGWGYRWQLWSIAYQNYLSGGMKEKYNSQLSTLQMVNYQRTMDLPSIRIPYTKQPGNYADNPEKPEFSARLLFYRGMIYNSQDDLYPMGSSDNISYWGNKIPEKSLTMLNEGEYGIYTQRWLKYLIWHHTRKEMKYLLTQSGTLAFDRKYSIFGLNLILKKRSVNYSIDQVLPSESEFFIA